MSPKRLLLIEEDQGHALVVAEWIARDPGAYEITTVNSMDDALAAVAPDIIILSLCTTKHSAVTFLARLFEKFPTAPIVMHTVEPKSAELDKLVEHSNMVWTELHVAATIAIPPTVRRAVSRLADHVQAAQLRAALAQVSEAIDPECMEAAIMSNSKAEAT